MTKRTGLIATVGMSPSALTNMVWALAHQKNLEVQWLGVISFRQKG